jgi:hypothetical protein
MRPRSPFVVKGDVAPFVAFNHPAVPNCDEDGTLWGRAVINDYR